MTRQITVLAIMFAAALPSIAVAQARPGASRAAEAVQAPAPAARASPGGSRPPEASRAPAPVTDDQNARETRDRVHEILEQYPPSVGQVLQLDPTLLSKPDYMASYPKLAAYVGQHPEVAH